MVAARIGPEDFAAQSSVDGRFLHVKSLVYAASRSTAIVRGKSGLDRNRTSRDLEWWTGDVKIGVRRVRAHASMMRDDVPSLPVVKDRARPSLDRLHRQEKFYRRSAAGDLPAIHNGSLDSLRSWLD
jgi:hypothetical protein